MTAPSPLMEALGRIAYEFTQLKPFLPTYLHLLISALFPIYTGSHASLSRPSSAAKPPRKDKSVKEGKDTEDEDDSEQKVRKMEGLSPSDAITFPILAGITLASLYFLIKWLKDPAILNKVLNYYFSTIGMFFVVKFVRDGVIVLRSFVLPTQYTLNGNLWQVRTDRNSFETSGKNLSGLQKIDSPFPGRFSQLNLPPWVSSRLWHLRSLIYQKVTVRTYVRSFMTVKNQADLVGIYSILIALSATTYFTFVDKPWWLTNFVGFSFVYGALLEMSPTTFSTGALLLSALFFYDIYFVFFTPLMVTVATKLDIPIKLLFPRPPPPDEDPTARALAMLGLGDLVIPGMMIGLALRFDLYLFYKRKQTHRLEPASGSEGSGTDSEGSEVETQEGTLLHSKNHARSDLIQVPYKIATGGWGERFWTRSLLKQKDGLSTNIIDGRNFPKTYFCASLIGYVVGMVVTLLVMQVAGHAQPALLYLVPGVLIPIFGTALVRGELREVWEYSEASDDDDEDEKEVENEKEREKEKEVDKLRSLWERFYGRTLLFFFNCRDSPENTRGKHKGKSNDAERKATEPENDTEEKDSKEKSTKKTERKDKLSPSESITKAADKIFGRDMSRELVALSISLPEKHATSKNKQIDSNPAPSLEDELRSASEGKIALTPEGNLTPVTDSSFASVSVVEGEGEPPVKRRRREDVGSATGGDE